MTASSTKYRILSASLTLFAFSCSGKSVNDVGDVNTPTAGSGGGSGSTSNAAGAPTTSAAGDSAAGGAAGKAASGSSGAATEDAAGAPSGIDGTWRGYIENYKNNDKTDTVEISISKGGLVGQIVFGDAKAPAPATDPEAEYPPSPGPNMGALDVTGPFAGFAFTLISPSFSGIRLQFDVAGAEVFGSWCELQTSYKDNSNANGGYACLPNWLSSDNNGACWQENPMTMEQVVRGCGQLQLCLHEDVCACTKNGCMADSTATVHFDLAIAESKADGSAAGLDAQVHNVHLTKQ